MRARSNFPKTQKKTAMTDDAQPIKKAAGKRAPSAERVAAFQTGISAESRACVYLIAKGYRILARRFKTPFGEIDIVARRRGLLAFVAVKARTTLDNAAYSVTPQQRRRIVDAAQIRLAAHDEHANSDMRFDVILIAPKSLPRHLMAAFDASA